jgi:3-oxoacyl-[acyl-carrier protein] reductase
MHIDLSGQVALVTGASKGIGRAVALALAASGVKVAVNYHRSEAAAEGVVRDIQAQGGEALLVRADVTKLDQIDEMVSRVEESYGKIDILVNNAGHLIQRVSNVEISESLYDEVMDLNLKSTVFVTKRVVPGMIARRSGTIINMSSVAAHTGGGGGSAVYAASKAAVIAYSKGLAKEIAPYGIRVNIVSPGYIGNTDFHSTVSSEEYRRSTIASVPLGRQGEPEDVAGVVLFLASGLSAYLTGETIEINGGTYMR